MKASTLMGTEIRGAKPHWLRDSDTARDFLTTAVHDLREPLRAIRSSSELLIELQGELVHENAVHCVRYISEGVDRMESLIRDLAEYLRGELNDLEPEETDLHRALAEARRQLHRELREKEAVLTHDPLPVVRGDFARLALVFRCLIDNACKFLREQPPRIHVAVQQQESEWIFAVQDNGAGFNPNYRERIFNPFERLNGKRYPGSGLARRILDQHGGRIWAESQENQGSTFWFTLPVEVFDSREDFENA
jgi:signal transduction histidine kinase